MIKQNQNWDILKREELDVVIVGCLGLSVPFLILDFSC